MRGGASVCVCVHGGCIGVCVRGGCIGGCVRGGCIGGCVCGVCACMRVCVCSLGVHALLLHVEFDPPTHTHTLPLGTFQISPMV